MKFLLAVIISIALGYLLGSCNFSIIIVKIMTGKDIRELGSKNAGLTNTYRCAGKTCALLTLAGDLLKGVLAVAFSMMFATMLKAGLKPDNDTLYIGYIAGISAIMGHIFPLYYGFRGGKGVLVAAASFLMIDPKVFIAIFSIFVVILAISKYVSLASIFSATYCPIAVFCMSFIVENQTIGASILYTLLSAVMAVTVVWKHKPNIDRLIAGNENKFSFKSGSLTKK
ncbi:MAG: glycerol-3-phosphate 1-O-acyltransferase PlsY [Ruminococcus flavefaciens]|nr:glycerol-3-phosphate 1-O-acyltransferase PlsY [Ruminococcus flavefaciens]